MFHFSLIHACFTEKAANLTLTYNSLAALNSYLELSLPLTHLTGSQDVELSDKHFDRVQQS